jgi:hypothetical protein
MLGDVSPAGGANRGANSARLPIRLIKSFDAWLGKRYTPVVAETDHHV